MINKPVYQVWANTLRFGVVTEEKIEKNWKYFRVRWVMDDAYRQAIKSMLELRSEEYDPNHEWHRRDHLVFYDPQELWMKTKMTDEISA